MNDPVKPFTPLRLSPHTLLAALGVISVGLFQAPLRELAALALSADAYSYILLIPLISAFIFYLERGKLFGGTEPYRHITGAGFMKVLFLFLCFVAIGLIRFSGEYALTVKIAALVFVWMGLFAICYGFQALKAARFSFLLLLLLTPPPEHFMYKVVTNLQWGSAEAAYLLFQLAGVPVFRTGVNFELPVVGIQVARECSSIHSACALFITSLLVGHLLLKSLRAKVCLTLLAIPIAMITNAVRIVTLWSLATKVDIGFLYGNLHHNGGVLFSLVSLSILMSCLYILRKTEKASPVATMS